VGFPRPFQSSTLTALAELICSNVPFSRAANATEIAHFIPFLAQFSDVGQDCKLVLTQALASRRPSPALNNALIALRDELAEEERLPFMQEVIKLQCSLPGAPQKLCSYTLFVGKFLGINERVLNALFLNMAATIVPKRQ
jgi:hypothetical protein